MAQSQHRTRTATNAQAAADRIRHVESVESDPYPAEKALRRPSALYGETAEQVDKAVAYLDTRVGQLYERLGPVMTPHDDGDRDSVPAELDQNDGEMIENLRSVAARLYGIAATLDTIHRRLVLAGDV